MADFQEPKQFAFGDLNPVQKSKSSKSMDPSRVSVLDAIKEVITGHYTPDSSKGIGPYKGVVLRVEEPMDQNNPAPGNWLSTIFGEQGLFESLLSVPKQLDRYKVRIPELHNLPVPTKFAQSATEVGEHQNAINRYPTFIAHNSNTEKAGPGDIVWVDFGNRENFEDPTFIGPVFPPPNANSGGSGGGAGASASGAFGDCGGGAGYSGASGGVMLTKIPISENGKWPNAMYLSSKETSKRNKSDPMKPVKLAGGFGFKTTKDYVSAGGSGRSVSGKMGLGSVSNMQSELARYLTAMRIVIEDQSDRGYILGGKPVNPAKGGIDCSGFVCAVRNMMEFLLHPEFNKEDIGPYGLAKNIGDKQLDNWRDLSLLVRPTYGTTKKPKTDCIEHIDGWSWVEPFALFKASMEGRLPEGAVSNPDNYINYLSRVTSGQLGGEETAVPTHFYEIVSAGGQFHFMPGDEITHTPFPGPGPSWVKSEIGITHIMQVFADPDGNLRLAESGGPHSGTGSRPLQEYLDLALKQNKKIWMWQRPEWSGLWGRLGGRPNEPWTRELCERLGGAEYFSAPNIASQSLETEKVIEGEQTEKVVDNQTSSSVEITKDNITIEIALAEAQNQAEKDEITSLATPTAEAATPSSIANTAAGKRVLEKAAAKTTTTPASGATSDAMLAAPAPAPVPVGDCSGGSYASSGGFTIGANRPGEAIGNIPFIGTLGEVRTNPKMVLKKVEMDKTGKDNWKYNPISVREDVAVNVDSVRSILKELGGLISSSGASRSLGVNVKAGQSATSFHYTSLAMDTVLPEMMNRLDRDNTIIEFDPEENGRFIVWVRSSKTSGVVDKGSVKFEVEHKTLNAIKQASKGSGPPYTSEVTGYFINLTKIMRAYGLDGIGAVGKSWYKTSSGVSEAWHFDFRKNAGLITGSTTFGMTLETVHNISSEPPWAYAGRIWRGGYFGK